MRHTVRISILCMTPLARNQEKTRSESRRNHAKQTMTEALSDDLGSQPPAAG